MDPQQHPSTEILHDFSPHFRVYKDGRVERLVRDDTIAPSFDPKTRVQSKDVTISPGLSARIYLPRSDNNISEITKLPLLIYFHGGAFCLLSSSSSTIHNYVNSMVSEAHLIAVSVDYRLAPEHPIPACYDDAWVAAQWVTSHSARSGPDLWLATRADFERVYLAGDSAGANICQDILGRAGPGGFLNPDVAVTGVALVHPFFGDGKPDRLWNFLCPGTTGVDDPRLNPASDLARLRRAVGCRRVMVCVDRDDWLRERGVRYYEALKESGWEGEVEFVESKGGGHVFYRKNLECDEAVSLVRKIASFINNK